MPREAPGPAECPDEDTFVLFLAGALPKDAEADVRRHVNGCDACRAVLAEAVRDQTLDDDSEMPAAPTFDPMVIAGKYRLEGEIGTGGMGRVFRARHLVLDRPVAIKILHIDLASEASMVRRFEREARAAAALRSRHVVQILDIDFLPSGSPFIVMELLDGCDLNQLLVRRGPLPLADAYRYVLEACDGIAEAHSRGIVHRDLKPHNLFLTRDPSPGLPVGYRASGGYPALRPPGATTNENPAIRPQGGPQDENREFIKVLDFGLAKALPGTEAAKASDTATGLGVIGSPEYMSCEQVVAAPHVDHRTDIWSIGATFYKLITGRAPFEAPNFQLLRLRIVRDNPIPMSVFRPDVPGALQEIVSVCLRKNPVDRWASIEAFANAMRSIQGLVQNLASIPPPQVPPVRDVRVDLQAPVPTVPPAPSSDDTTLVPRTVRDDRDDSAPTVDLSVLSTLKPTVKKR